jgi:ubiquinone/menaquinone biosynthesis C-methylase UbiE
MKRRLKKLAARLPLRWQQELKRRYFANQIRKHSFRAPEPEFEMLSPMVSAGDWVLDVGANIGQYTLRLSELVGESGRVISFEPVPETFELLAAMRR